MIGAARDLAASCSSQVFTQIRLLQDINFLVKPEKQKLKTKS